MRKATEDALARTAAERFVGEELVDCQIVEELDGIEPAGRLLGQVAKTVEFERGTSKDPDKNTVPMRRLVITGPWEVDPDGLKTQQ